MNNKEFDDIIKKKLESLSSGSTDDEWELFREKWENSADPDVVDTDISDRVTDDHTDQLFDDKVKEGMRGLRMPFNSAHWVRLKAQLEAEALFKKRLFVAKTVEILMLVLIVMGILNVWPIQTELYEIPVYDTPMVATVPVDKAAAEKYEQDQIEKQSTVNKVRIEMVEKVTNISTTTFFGTQGDNDRQSDNNTVISPLTIELLKSTKVSPIDKGSLKDIFPFFQQKENQSGHDADEKSDTAASSERNTTTLLVAQLSPKDDRLKVPERPIGYPDIVLNTDKKRSNVNSYVSLAIGPRVNLVNSPFDPVYEIDPYNTLNTNFNISAKIHKEVGPVEMYVGLGYTNTSYKPLVIEELYKNQAQEFNQASLENIEFKTVNVPVGVNYNVIDNNHLQLYASAGVDVNLIGQANYEVFDVPAGSSRSEGSRESFKPSFKSGRPQVSQRAKLSQKEFNLGILQGGALKDNLYASATVGLGLVKKLGENTSVFVEPKYSHFISSKGLGPNLDKVHAVSIDLGFKYEIN